MGGGRGGGGKHSLEDYPDGRTGLPVAPGLCGTLDARSPSPFVNDGVGWRRALHFLAGTQSEKRPCQERRS